MKFAIGHTQYFNEIGFNTEHWRKSLDGSQAVCHYEFASILCGADEITVYDVQSEEFKALLAGPEWSEQAEEAPVE